MNPALKNALALAQRALGERGYVVRKSRAGVKYIVPFSRNARWIRAGVSTNDGSRYVTGMHGNLLLSRERRIQ